MFYAYRNDCKTPITSALTETLFVSVYYRYAMGSKSPQNEEDSHNGEGPISPEQLESRNTKRSKAEIKQFLDINIDGDVTIEVDGGTDVEALIDGKVEQLNGLAVKLIVLGVVILLIVIGWRMGTVIRLTEMLMS